ncbi:MAG: ABC transporter ATP-binding protein/permease [Bacteriovoracaceae bacterium]|nr:ABC transporter ATP-binding protein/permease [Bacteriovoracaceae bacterium]
MKSLDNFSFLRFTWSLIRKRPWHYAGGILSVIVLDAVDMLPSLIVKEITDQVQQSPEELDILKYTLTLVGCYFLIALLRLCWRFLLMIPSRTMECELRQKAFEKILNADFALTSHLKTGDVVSILSQDLSNIRMFMGPGILVLFDSLAYLIFIPSTLFYILGTDALWVLMPFVILALAVTIVHRPLEKAYGEVSDTLGDLSQYVLEESQGARFFRAEGLIELRRHKYDLLLKGLFGRQLGISKWELGLDGTLQTVIQTSYLTVLVLAWQGQGVMAQGLGTLTVSLQLLDKLLWPLMSTNYLMNLYQQARSGARHYHSIDELPMKEQGHQHLPHPLQEISIVNLSTKTPEGKTLLDGIDLQLKAGEHIALVGGVGSGKTVLLQTLAGLWEPRHLSYSHFTFDHTPFEELDRRSLWKQLSYIPQSPQIFSRSLGMNISPHHPLEPHALWAALDKADLSQDVTLFPEGLRTLVGEKGMNLSGGQKQRTLIARSFHSNARLYLWDDAISALDPATEHRVIAALRKLDPEAILILATHRLSSLKNFDRILVLEQGRITRMGTFEDIKRDHALFASLLIDEQESRIQEGQWTI